MVAWAGNTFGVPVEPDADPIGFDLKTRSGKDPEHGFRPFENERTQTSR
jgi:hypothetical protein